MKGCQRIKSLISICSLALLIIGCTTTRAYWGDWQSWGEWRQTGNNEHQDIQITSNPSEAEIYINGNLVGTTPATINLTYPVLKSERTQYQYEEKVPGALEQFLLRQQTTTSRISSQKEEQFKNGDKSYSIEIRKEGYLRRRAFITIPGNTYLTFQLKEKPVFAIKKISVRNNFKLTLVEKLYEFLYGKRFSIDATKLENLKSQTFSSEAFDNPLVKTPDYYLEGNIVVQRPSTEITILLTDRFGRLITTRTTSIDTKTLETLPAMMESLIRSITDKYLR